MSAFIEGDTVIITSEDSFDAMTGVIVAVDQPEPGDFVGGLEEWEIDASTTYLVQFPDGKDSWFDPSEMELA